MVIGGLYRDQDELFGWPYRSIVLSEQVMLTFNTDKMRQIECEGVPVSPGYWVLT